jgi:hypothetical protein
MDIHPAWNIVQGRNDTNKYNENQYHYLIKKLTVIAVSAED